MTHRQDLDSKDLVQLVEQSMEEDEMDYHDDGYIELVLKMMGSMCDGQNTVLQVSWVWTWWLSYILYWNGQLVWTPALGL